MPAVAVALQGHVGVTVADDHVEAVLANPDLSRHAVAGVEQPLDDRRLERRLRAALRVLDCLALGGGVTDVLDQRAPQVP